ncbi:MAG TPA: hypothetical protein VMK82_09195 [Steroidobacteraceae bacterium]|nr:hypothetical protein [Steroidobacteraceae bacterium]
MSDIARIEVISGPGATLWGANAMHGVINIITRPAHLTERIGNDPRGHASLASLMDLGRNQMFDLSVRHREYPAPSGLLIRRAVMAEARWRR